MTLQTIGIIAGLLALGWAFAVRRSPADCIMTALCGVLLLMLAMGWTEPLRFPPYTRLPELVLGGLGIALLVRAFVSRSRPPAVAASGPNAAGPGEGAGFTPQYIGQLPPRVQNTGLIIIGVIVLVPLLLLALVVAAFMIGGIGHQERARKAQDQRDIARAEVAIKATLDRPETARFRHHGLVRRQVVVTTNHEIRGIRQEHRLYGHCGEYTAEGMQGYRRFIYIDVAAGYQGVWVADEHGMLRHDENGEPLDPRARASGRGHQVRWSDHCGVAGTG